MAYEDTSLYNLLLAALSAPRGFHSPVFGVKNRKFNKIVEREVEPCAQT